LTAPPTINALPCGEVTARAACQTLAFGPIAITLTSNDSAATEWLVEFLEPWFSPTQQPAEWRVRLLSSRNAYAELNDRRPLDAVQRPCFALDQETVSLPAWPAGDRVTVADAQRSYFLIARPFEFDVVADPGTHRWRFSLMRVLREIAATRLRRTQLEIHAAALEAAGRAILISGPKGAGKTTLSIHLLRSGQCRLVANDRVFAGGAAESFAVRGVPTAVRIRSDAAALFPELRRGLPRVADLHMLNRDERTRAIEDAALPQVADFGLSLTQLAHQLRVEPRASAPLGAIVFPEIRTGVEGWTVERLAPNDVSARIWANLFGEQPGQRGPTLFEDLDGGPSVPSRALADALSRVATGYRVTLGRHAYAEAASSARLLETLLAS
jgi:hypothetical protein